MRKWICLTLCAVLLFLAMPTVFAGAAHEGSSFTDPGRMEDSDFFGVWENGAWKVEPKLNYEYAPELAAVEAAAQTGDYYRAKEALLYYYQNRGLEQPLTTERDTLSARVQAAGIAYSQAPVVSILPISAEPQWYEADVTGYVNAGGSAVFFMHSLNRDFGEEGTENVVRFASRESGENVSYLEVVQGGKAVILNNTGDMYLRGGRYASQNYGTEDEILVSEWLPYEGVENSPGASPADSGTRQAHVRYSTVSLDPELPIDRATLHLYGSSTEEGKEIGIFSSTITTTWDEKEINWYLYPNQAFSYQGIAGGYDWRNPSSAHAQFYNVNNRLQTLPLLFAEGYETNNEYFETRAIESFLDYIHDVNGLTNDWYASEKRLNAAFRNNGNSEKCFFGALHTSVIDPVSFGAMIKFMWQETDAMSGAPMVGQINLNGMSSVVGALLRFTTYFPEFRDRGRYIKEAQRWTMDMAEQCLFDDGSYRESSSGYDASVLGDINGFYDIIKDGDVTIPEAFKTYYAAFAKSQMNLTQPDKEQFRWGDGGIKRDMKERIAAAANNTGDPELLYYGTDGGDGILPQQTSYFAPTGQLAVQRSDWTDRGVAAFIIGRIGGSHSHHDTNHINLYAYDRILLNDTGKASYDNRHPAVAWQSNRSESHNTVEVNEHGQNMVGDNSMMEDADVVMYMTSLFDYYSGESRAYSEATHTRRLSFIKDRRFYIVTDFMTNLNGEENKYNQTWHIPDSSRYYSMEPDTKTVKTSYTSGANLSVVPVNPAALTSAGMDSNPLGRSHVSYKITSQDNAYFNTILFPFENEAQDIVTKEIPVTGVTEKDATAFTMELPGGGSAVYYADRQPRGERRFDRYDADAAAFYAERSEAGTLLMAAANGVKSVKEKGAVLIEASRRLDNVTVKYEDTFLTVEAPESFDAATDFIRIAAPESVTRVRLNNEIVPFFKLDGTVVIGTYSSDLRYTVADGRATASLPALTASYPVTVGKAVEFIDVTVPEGTVLTADASWNGKITISPMGSSVCQAGSETYGQAEFLSGTLDRPLRISAAGRPGWRGAPLVGGSVLKPSQQLAADDPAGVNGMETAFFSGADYTAVYTRNAGTLVFYSEAPKDDPPGGGGGGGGGGSVPAGQHFPQRPTVTPPPATVTPMPAPAAELPFGDIAAHWAREAILTLAEAGIVLGDNGSFHPDRAISRAETTALICRAAALDTSVPYAGGFDDVSADDWFAGSVQAALANGLANGRGDGFAPAENVTRQELCVLLMNAYQYLGGASPEKAPARFSDEAAIANWAREGVAGAVALGLAAGDPDGTFRPEDSATRAEAAAMLERLLKSIKGEE